MYAYTFALIERVKADRKGVTALEYGLLAGLVSLAVVGGAMTLGTNIGTMFTTIGTALAGIAMPT